jgi:hypothetical protein
MQKQYISSCTLTHNVRTQHGVEFDLILLNGFSQVDNEAFAFALPDRTRVHVEEFGRADISDTEAQRLEVAKGFTWPALWAAMMAPPLFVDGTWSISSTGNQLFAFTPLLAMLPGAAAEAYDRHMIGISAYDTMVHG